MKLKISAVHRSVELAVQRQEAMPEHSLYPKGITSSLLQIEKNPDHPMADAIRQRISLFDAARDDVDFQREILERCAEDPIYFIDNWVWTYDPRRKPSTIPFLMFDRQREFIRWLMDRIGGCEDGLVEKSRDAGLSWLCIGFAAWQLIFVPGSKVTFGSRKADLVDKLGNPDSLFEKLRILLRNLPDWMRPVNLADNELRFINRDNGSSITGEAGDQMGRGGRSSLYFLDEFAFVERANTVDAAVSENSEVKIYISTPNGNGNSFAKKRHGGELPVFNIHWLDDPRKWAWEILDAAGVVLEKGEGRGAPPSAVYPWYEKRKRQLDPVVLAQEVDIDYAASVDGVCIPNKWVMAAVDLLLPTMGERSAGLDISDGGRNKSVFIYRYGPVVKKEWIQAWSQPEPNTTETAYKARQYMEMYNVPTLNYDAIGVGAGVGGTLKSLDKKSFKIVPVVGGLPASDIKWPAFDNRDSSEIFKNLRAELWWLLRRRFEKTYEHVNGIAEHPIDELISIPNVPELISQLSQPLRKFTEAGKILIEDKESLASRGVESPDYADALVYAFAKVNLTTSVPDWMKKMK